MKKNELKNLKEKYKKNPEKYAEEYFDSLLYFATKLSFQDDEANALSLRKEAYDVAKEQYKKNPAKWIESYVKSIQLLANNYDYLEVSQKKVKKLYKKAAKILKKAFEDNPEKWANDYLESLEKLADFYNENEKFDKLAVLYKEALKIEEKINKINPDMWDEDNSYILDNIKDLYFQTDIGKKEQNILLSKKVLKIMKKIYKDNPDLWEKFYAKLIKNMNFDNEMSDVEVIDESIKLTLNEFLNQFIDKEEIKEDEHISEIEDEFFELFKKDLKALKYVFKQFEPNDSYAEYNILNSIGNELVKEGKISEAKKVYELNTKFCLKMVDCTWIAINEIWEKVKDRELASKIFNKALDMDCVNMQSSWFLEYFDVIFDEIKDLELGKELVEKYAMFLVRSDGKFEDMIPVIKKIKKLYNEKEQKEIFYNVIEYVIGDMREDELCKVLNAIYDKSFECKFSDADMLSEIIKKYNDEELYEYLKNEGYINL